MNIHVTDMFYSGNSCIDIHVTDMFYSANFMLGIMPKKNVFFFFYGCTGILRYVDAQVYGVLDLLHQTFFFSLLLTSS